MELPGVPAANRGPVVAVVRLEDVKFSVQVAADVAKSQRRRGVEWIACNRMILEQAAAMRSSWVAWSEPAQKLADSITVQPAVVAPERGPVVAVLELADVRRAVSWCAYQLSRRSAGRVPPRDRWGFKRAGLIGSSYVALARMAGGAA